MAYQSLYRRYRPARFGDVRGQEHVVAALRNAVREDRVGHAYLLSGPRGTGKTTSARLLAKVLNCEKPDDGEPCGECGSCLAVAAGTSFDLHELDAASNNKVDDVRDLIEKAALGTPGRTKVYILDEVHMLTPAASNALLKTLEEPPDHVVFVLATTDPQKVLPTIRSRTQHFEVRLLSADELTELARSVATDAGLDVGDDEIDFAVRKGAGSARDTLSALDQVAAAGGVPAAGEALHDLLDALAEHDVGGVIRSVQEAVDVGREPRLIGEMLIADLRNAFLAEMGADLGHVTDEARARAAELGRRIGPRSLTAALEAIGDALVELRQAPDPRIPLEVALIRLARPEADGSLESLEARVERLERSSGGATAPGASPPRPEPASSPADAVPSAGVETDPGEGSAPTPPPSGGGADAARRALADRGGKSKSALGAHRAPAGSADPTNPAAPSADSTSPEPTSPDSTSPEPTSPEPKGAEPTSPGGDAAPDPQPAAPPPAPAPTAAATDAPLPSRDELTLAWGDGVLAALPGKARAFFQVGRFAGVGDGRAEFALPNKVHARKCESQRGEVESALAAHFGRPVPIRLVVDADASSRPEPATSPADSAPDDPEDHDVGPVDELADADNVEETHLARITSAFPGAEVLPLEGDDT